MNTNFTFNLKSTLFDENYLPSANTRITTNFANLARGPGRQQNLRNALQMIDSRFNALVQWDNPKADRYSLQLEIISVEINVDDKLKKASFPLIELLKTNILDRHTNTKYDGVVGNNYSSYLRDYDFSILLPKYNAQRTEYIVPDDFGDLHGKLFKLFANSSTYREHFQKSPVICISVSTSKIYHRTENQHPILGVEYKQNELSLTDHYFAKMGLQVRFFMPPHSVAPLAFYFYGDLLCDYSNLELISTISTMETFQRIYRPEIYNANSVAGVIYQPSLKYQDYSLTQVVYDREERNQLAIEQGRFAEESLIQPYQQAIEQWVANCA